MSQNNWPQHKNYRIHQPAILGGIAIFLVSMTLTLILHIKFSRREAEFLQETSNRLGQQIQNAIITQLTVRVQSLERQANHWNIYGPFLEDQFHAQARMQMEHFPGYEVIEWVDDSGTVKWAEPTKGHERALGFDLMAEPRRKNALLLAKQSHKTVFTPSLNLAIGGRGFLAFAPVKENDGRHIGFVVGVFRYDQLLKAILPIEQLENFYLVVHSNNEEIYHYGKRQDEHEPSSIREFETFGTQWKITLWPVVGKVKGIPLSGLILIVGGFISLLLGLAVALWLIAKLQGEKISNFSAREFNPFFELSGTGAVMVDPVTNKYIRANVMFCKMLGYTEEELKNLTFIDISHLQERDRERQNYEEIKAGSRDHWQVEKRYIRKDGSEVWGLLSGTIVRSEDGRPLYSAAIVQDITAVRRAQDDLRQALRTRDEFLSIASHELKTPLTSLQLQTQMTKRTLQLKGEVALAPDRLKAFLEQTEKQVQRLSLLVNDMLEISRIGLGKLSLNRDSFDLGILAKDTCEKLSSIAQEAQTIIEVDASVPVTGKWDGFRIEQVITNLVTNAIKYGDRSPVKVRVWSDQDCAYISVSDQGRGIDLADQARIFERFERAISPNEVSGLGLGLFISNEIVKAHDGTIKVDSSLGKGATFTVRLPLH